MILKRYRLVRERLAAAPQRERDLFLALGGVANELVLLQKLILWTPRGSAAEPFLEAQITQSVILFRLLAGKIHEAWRLIDKAFFRAKISREYDGKMDPEAQESLLFLKRYHSSSNVLEKVRNEYAFHFSAPRFGHGLSHKFEDPLPIYIAPQPANCLFYCSELLANASLIAEVVTEKVGGKFEQMIEEASMVVSHWLNFISGYQSLFVQRHESTLEDQPETLQLEQIQPLEATVIPWFVEPAAPGMFPNDKK